MKYLIVAAAIFAVVSFTSAAECDDATGSALNECYNKFTKAVDLKSPVVNKKFCKNFDEHVNCVKESTKGCSPSIDEMAKILKTDRLNFLKLLFIEIAYKNVCIHPYRATKEEEKCLAEFSDKDLDCGHPKDCTEIKEYLPCYKKAIEKKCKNEEIAKIYADAAHLGFKTIFAKCA